MQGTVSTTDALQESLEIVMDELDDERKINKILKQTIRKQKQIINGLKRLQKV